MSDTVTVGGIVAILGRGLARKVVLLRRDNFLNNHILALLPLSQLSALLLLHLEISLLTHVSTISCDNSSRFDSRGSGVLVLIGLDQGRIGWELGVQVICWNFTQIVFHFFNLGCSFAHLGLKRELCLILVKQT